jgi:hypothetical protein
MVLNRLIQAAKEEDWDFVDKELPEFAKDPANIEWAYGVGLADSNGNVRDLGASILEIAKISPDRFGGMRDRITQHMKGDDNPYVRYRCAFALAAHGQANDQVRAVLMEATKDDDVAAIAKDYLKSC